MRNCQSSKLRNHLPKIWLLTDPRFGDRLLYSIRKLPMRSGVVVRHYDDLQRKKIYNDVASICRKRGHKLVVADHNNVPITQLVTRWRADGCYWGRPSKAFVVGKPMIKIVSAHDIRELRQAILLKADLILLSPIFATRSHKGAKPMGVLRFNHLASLVNIPVLALGGMDKKRAELLHRYAHGFAAIDSLIT